MESRIMFANLCKICRHFLQGMLKDFIDCFILASCTVLFRNDAKSQCEDTVLLIPHNV